MYFCSNVRRVVLLHQRRLCVSPSTIPLPIAAVSHFFSCLQQGTINLKHSWKKRKISIAIFGTQVLWLNLFLEEHRCSVKSKLPNPWHGSGTSRCQRTLDGTASAWSKARMAQKENDGRWDFTFALHCCWASHTTPLQHALAILTPAHSKHAKRMGATYAISSLASKYNLPRVPTAPSPTRTLISVVCEI